MATIEGIWIPLVTPFYQGEIDLGKAQTLALSMLDAGVHGLVVCGTTGEAATLSENEQSRLLTAILEVTQKRCPILMGISGSDTRALTKKVKHLSQYSPDGFLVSAPSYVRPSQEGIRRHFEAIADATSSDIVLYNIPARTGVNIEVDTVLALESHSNIVAIKECSGNLTQTAEIIQRSQLHVLCGDDALLFPMLCLGGHGAISAAAHIRPDLFVQLFKLSRAGDIAGARALFNQLLPMIKILFSEPNPAPVKAALAMLNMLEEELRLPMTSMSKPGKGKLSEVLLTTMNLPKTKSNISSIDSKNHQGQLNQLSQLAHAS